MCKIPYHINGKTVWKDSTTPVMNLVRDMITEEAEDNKGTDTSKSAKDDKLNENHNDDIDTKLTPAINLDRDMTKEEAENDKGTDTSKSAKDDTLNQNHNHDIDTKPNNDNDKKLEIIAQKALRLECPGSDTIMIRDLKENHFGSKGPEARSISKVGINMSIKEDTAKTSGKDPKLDPDFIGEDEASKYFIPEGDLKELNDMIDNVVKAGLDQKPTEAKKYYSDILAKLDSIILGRLENNQKSTIQEMETAGSFGASTSENVKKVEDDNIEGKDATKHFDLKQDFHELDEMIDHVVKEAAKKPLKVREAKTVADIKIKFGDEQKKYGAPKIEKGIYILTKN